MTHFIQSQRVKILNYLDPQDRTQMNPPVTVWVVCLVIWIGAMFLSTLIK